MRQNMKEQELSSVFYELINEYSKLRNSLKDIYSESEQIRVLSLNTSIEAARAGEKGVGFRVIAKAIKDIAEECDNETQKSLKLVNNIEQNMDNLIGIRTADMAFDTIDKIDRNLFERFCDVQAWATFGKIIEALESKSEESVSQAAVIIENLVRIYEVYHDVILADADGNIVCTGIHKELSGRNIKNTQWFEEVCSTHNTWYSDMYYSDVLGDWTVSYSCPVVNKSGTFLGVLSTRFNWSYIQQIIQYQQAKLSAKGEVILINKHGLVICAARSEDILKKSFASEKVFELIKEGSKSGFYSKKSHNNLIVCGYAKTSGYNSYIGKEWSVIIYDEY